MKFSVCINGEEDVRYPMWESWLWSGGGEVIGLFVNLNQQTPHLAEKVKSLDYHVKVNEGLCKLCFGTQV